MAEPGSERGFTLIEVLVALAIVGMILVGVYRLFGTGVMNVSRGSDQLSLALTAEALLERTRADLDPRSGEVRGRLPNGQTWRLLAKPMPLPPRAGERPAEGLGTDQSQSREGQAEQGDESAARRGSNLIPAAEAAQNRDQLWIVQVEVSNQEGRKFALSTLRWLPAPTS
jgi:prepilin-type N-terminal cleavage/methylation domain-containing protein